MGLHFSPHYESGYKLFSQFLQFVLFGIFHGGFPIAFKGQGGNIGISMGGK